MSFDDRLAPDRDRKLIRHLVLFVLTIFAVVLAGLAFASTAHAQAPTTGKAAAIAALKAGGVVAIQRHGYTFADQFDANPFDLSNCSLQRQLDQRGKAQASQVGVGLKLLGVKVSSITTSRYCRAIETGGRIAEQLGVEAAAITSSNDFTEGGGSVSPNENKRRAEALHGVAAKPPAMGAVAWFVTHKPNIVDAFGADVLDIGEGEILVVRWANNSPAIVGRLRAADLLPS